MVLSRPQETIILELEEILQSSTASLCPYKVYSSFPLLPSYTFILLSTVLIPATIYLLSGEIANVLTLLAHLTSNNSSP